MELTNFLHNVADIDLKLKSNQSGITITLSNKNFGECVYKKELGAEARQDDVTNAIERVLSDFLGDMASLYKVPSKTKRIGLTKAQRNFYNKVSKVMIEKGYTPSFSEMCSLCGYSSKKAAVGMVDKLIEKNWMAKENKKIVLLK